MIVPILLICLAAFSIGGVGLYVASRNQQPQIRRSRFAKFVTYICIVTVVVSSAFAGRFTITMLTFFIVLLGARELGRALPLVSKGRHWGSGVIVAIYVFIGAGSLAFVWNSSPAIVVFLYLVVCAFDGFSQVSGQLLGRSRLAPRLSPGKTIEGTLGGLLFALAIALLLRQSIGWSTSRSIGICCFTVLTALAGDLMASAVKRRSGLKDFGTLLPGHGGILDRFDSFLFASASFAAFGLLARQCATIFS